MWTRPSWGGNGRLFMDFKDMMLSSCQLGDPCPTLLKFKLLIKIFWLSIQVGPLLSIVTTRTLVSYMTTIFHLMVLEFKRLYIGLVIVRLHRL
jgi:hypothetical protein